MPNRRILLTITVVALVALVIAAPLTWRAKSAAAPAAASAPAPVEVLAADLWTVQPVALARSLPITGTLRAANQTVVKTKVAGDLVQLLVREGQSVAKGQVIARIDPTEYEWRVRQQQAALAAAQAQLEMAAKTRANHAQLLAKGFISQNAFDAAQSSYEAAVGNRDAAAAALELARKALADTVIRAPMAGTVGERFAQPGEKLPVDGRILSLVDLGSLEIEAPVPADDVAAVRVGQPAEFRPDGLNRPLAARVVRISPATASGSRSVFVYLALEESDAGLRAGMFGQGRLWLARTEPVLAV
ncbi:MAG: efflux RND transporter periplasmic adaptor subunit, partial [Burkholderiaceae bacterium]|nr:efflux RND transporter periplasmic adaptor subunit [Burkholderiaceae bacterium]